MNANEFAEARDDLGLDNQGIAEWLGVSLSIVEKMAGGRSPVRPPVARALRTTIEVRRVAADMQKAIDRGRPLNVQKWADRLRRAAK